MNNIGYSPVLWDFIYGKRKYKDFTKTSAIFFLPLSISWDRSYHIMEIYPPYCISRDQTLPPSWSQTTVAYPTHISLSLMSYSLINNDTRYSFSTLPTSSDSKHKFPSLSLSGPIFSLVTLLFLMFV